MMVDTTFAERVHRLEKEAGRRPGRYRLKVLMLTVLGYGYIGFFLILFLTLLGLSLFIIWDGGATLGNLKMLALTATLSILLLKAMWIRFDLPEGEEITEKQAPELFRDLRDLTHKMKATRVDKVILNDDYNAAVASLPRLGIFGWNQQVLIIGLPLLMSLDRQQMKAVLAHELGHLSKADTRMGSWVYRVRATWSRLLVSLEENQQFGTFLFRWFFRWYFPLFDAYSFVLRRQEEYIADTLAAKATGTQVNGDALVTIHVIGRYYNEGFSQAVIRPAAGDAIPTPMSWFWENRNRLSREKAQTYMRDCLRESTGLADTHPSLKDRLHSLGVKAQLPTIPERAAAEEWLADLPTWIRRFDEEWLHHAEETIRELRQTKSEAEARIAVLAEKTDRTRKESEELASLYLEWGETTDAVPIYQQILEQFGDGRESATAHLELGKCYLTLDEDQKGVRHIKQAIALDWSVRMEGYEILEGYYRYIGDQDEAERMQQKAEDWAQLLEASEKETQPLTDEEEWIPHGSDPKWVEQLFSSCRKQSSIQTGYLVRKKLETIPERDHYVVGLVLEYPAKSSEEEYNDALIEWATEEWLPEELSYTLLILGDEEVQEKIKSIPGSMVYQRQKSETA